MTKRDKILGPIAIVIMIVSALIFYRGYFKKEISIATESAPDTEANQKTIVNLLPYGKQLDFNALEQRDRNLGITKETIYPYPTVSEADVGVPPPSLFGQ